MRAVEAGFGRDGVAVDSIDLARPGWCMICRPRTSGGDCQTCPLRGKRSCLPGPWQHRLPGMRNRWSGGGAAPTVALVPTSGTLEYETMEAFGLKLRQVLEESGRQQKEIALTWAEAAKKAGCGDLSVETVPSRLSELLRGKEKGFRFFFETPPRGRILLELLTADERMRGKLAEAADRLRETGVSGRVRVVVDVAGLTQEATEHDRLFEQITTFLRDRADLHPVRLLIDDRQYDRLPRSFDDASTKKWLSWSTTSTEDARLQAASLARPGCIVLSPEETLPPERAAVLVWDAEGLIIEPADWAEQFLASGQLAPIPRPEHLLEDLT